MGSGVRERSKCGGGFCGVKEMRGKRECVVIVLGGKEGKKRGLGEEMESVRHEKVAGSSCGGERGGMGR